MHTRLRTTDLLPIGELARRTGLAVSAIRFYEEKGLVEPIPGGAIVRARGLPPP